MTRVNLTYADYASLPDDGRRYELHDGELSVTPAPGTLHQRVLGNLFVIFWHHVRSPGLGAVFMAPTDCILADLTVVQPDIAFVAAQHASRISERAIEGAPTLAIEILSPSTEQVDRRRKLELYARHGVAYYWIVDVVERTIEAYTLEHGTYRINARLAG
ncbi:MAG: Uma2 family endonuclease, partial [Candidatus Rokuibacteriota bacterium]